MLDDINMMHAVRKKLETSIEKHTLAMLTAEEARHVLEHMKQFSAELLESSGG